MEKSALHTGELFAPEEVGGISLEDVFSAYFDCRRKKRGTREALIFEADYERKCIDLWRGINAATYRSLRSIVFIVYKPVQREVFAPAFESRIIDHLIARKLEPLLEEILINDSYSTRKGKGTLYGINRVAEHIRCCSENYSRDCYIMKLDIRSFFMDIPRQELYNRMELFIKERYRGSDLPTLLYLLRLTLLDRPEQHCIRQSPPGYWKGLPPDKSLFHSDGLHGLPIGRLTSQLGAAFILNELDHLITEQWGISYYGRYVDDMVLISPNRDCLLEVRNKMADWLKKSGFNLHPKKVYLQHYSKGVLFVGSMILPGRKYLGNRTMGYCYKALDKWNRLAREDAGYVYRHGEEFIAVLNSYFGMMKHFASYNLRRKLVARIGVEWWQVIYIEGHLEKAVLKKRYKPYIREWTRIREEIKTEKYT